MRKDEERDLMDEEFSETMILTDSGDTWFTRKKDQLDKTREQKIGILSKEGLRQNFN